jgi:hypothetical protein
MANPNKGVDPFLIGIIAVGVVGAAAFWYFGGQQEPAQIPPPAQPNLQAVQASKMQGQAPLWGNSENQDQGGGGFAPSPGGPAPGPGGGQLMPGGAPSGPPAGAAL